MLINKKKLLQHFVLLIVVVWITQILPEGTSKAVYRHNPHKVHIAFGFHGNLYHSFRVDTNDENGFGKDIRIIRRIIKVLDKYNDQGVPVKGVWDFDNLFSLQDLLPRYAPDIISDIKRRVDEQGDEAILMSYNNGLMSAMNQQEFTDSMKWAISNPWKSGVKDVFGTYSPIVRPQEMMTTPGNFKLYKQVGIPYISLYYSATNFDAFRMFSKPLSRVQAYNPITYKNPRTSEEIVVIPTYNIADIVENVDLRVWTEKLHHLQESGVINRDVLIFINFDADSEFWYGVDLPKHLQWLPHTGGLDGLISQVKDLEYVKFTNLMNYLEKHPPVGEVQFAQDTADGSFNGYNSWAEKAYAPYFWSSIERNRRAHSIVEKAFQFMNKKISNKMKSTLEESYLNRLRTLSTTNFGMATPYLAKQRENAVRLLIDKMDHYSNALLEMTQSELQVYKKTNTFKKTGIKKSRLLDAFWVFEDKKQESGGSGKFLNVSLPYQYEPYGSLQITNGNSRPIPVTIVDSKYSPDQSITSLKLYISPDNDLPDDLYFLYSHPCSPAKDKKYAGMPTGILENNEIKVEFNGHKLDGVWFKGVRQLEKGSLLPLIRYADDMITPDQLKISDVLEVDDHSKQIQVSGKLNIPGQTMLTPGAFTYHFTIVDNLPYIFISGRITYPETIRQTTLNSTIPAMMQTIDDGWKEIAPVELLLSQQATTDSPFKVIKRNYMGIQSSYFLDYYKHSAMNLNLDSVNNHITSEYIGIASRKGSAAVAMDTTVAANFAFSPLKMYYDNQKKVFNLKLNPFGTYYGTQYYPPTWGNGNGREAALLTGFQFHSAGPTYNGSGLEFSLMISFSQKNVIPEQVEEDLIAFARPLKILSLQDKLSGKDIAKQPVGNYFYFSDSLEETDTSQDIESGPIEKSSHVPDIPIGFKLKILWAYLNSIFFL